MEYYEKKVRGEVNGKPCSILIQNEIVWDVYPKAKGFKGVVVRRVDSLLGFNPDTCEIQWKVSGWVEYNKKDFNKICEMHGVHFTFGKKQNFKKCK